VPATVIFPETAPAEKFTVIVFVFDPDEMDAPEGNVQLYPVAFAIDGTV
jgi:hypothetical protein